MDAIAFDPGFVGGRSSPSRTSPGIPAGGARAFEDFLPRDDSTPPAPIDRPRSSDSERPPAAERPSAKSGTGTDTSSRVDRPDDRSDDRDDAPPADATAQAAAAPPPAKGPADPSGAAAGETEGTTAAKPVSAPAGATPSGQAATASTATAPNAAQAPNPNMPGNVQAGTPAAAALDMAPGEAAGTGGKTAAQPQNGAAPVDGGTPASPGLPADVAEAAGDPAASVSDKAGPTNGTTGGATTRVAAQQSGDAAGSPADDSGLHAGARNNPSARSPQAGAQQPGAPAGPAVAQAAESSGDPNGSPDTLTFAGTGDGDLSPASTGQSLSGTPSSPTQAAHGATAAGHRPIPTPTMLAEQIAVHIQRGMERGTDRIDIRLTPAELGRIEVRLELGHDGRVHAAIAVDRAETLDLLQRDARSLERALQDAGLKTDSGGLTFNLRGDGRQHSNTGFAANQAFAGNGPERSEPDAVAPEVAANIGERRIHLDGVVDIRV